MKIKHVTFPLGCSSRMGAALQAHLVCVRPGGLKLGPFQNESQGQASTDQGKW